MQLKLVIERRYACAAYHLRTVPVQEMSAGQIVWQGEVEVFGLAGHDSAKRCYGWARSAGADAGDERFMTVLEIPPVESAVSAVRLQFAKDNTKQPPLAKAANQESNP